MLTPASNGKQLQRNGRERVPSRSWGCRFAFESLPSSCKHAAPQGASLHKNEPVVYLPGQMRATRDGSN